MESTYNKGNLSMLFDSVELKNVVKTDDPAPNGSGSMAENKFEDGEVGLPHDVAGSLSSETYVYRQDVVRGKKNDALLGAVLEVAGDAYSEGSITDESDSEDDKDTIGGGCGGSDNNNGTADDRERNDSLPDGQVRVMWTDGSETTQSISDVTVVDRGFLHGDMVSSVSDPTGQLGLVVDVDITVDLLAANGELVTRVSSKDLKRIREFTVGDYVVFGPWLGRVDDVLDNVTVLFDDGSVCKVVKADPLRLKPVSRAITDDTSCPYYPGQRVRAVSSSVFRTSRWLSGLWKANRLEGTVIKVQAVSVVVYWIASAYLGVGTNSTTVPSEEQSPKNLTLLSCFTYANWQLGDWCLQQSPSLPSSSIGKASTGDLVEPAKGCASHIEHQKELPVEEYSDIHAESCKENPYFASEDPGLDLMEHQATEMLNTDREMQANSIERGDVSSQDALHSQLDYGHLKNCFTKDSESSKKSNKSQSQRNDSESLDGTARVDEHSGTGSSNILHESGSCSTSSVSKDTSHENWPAYRKKLRKVFFRREMKTRRRDETFERALCIVNTVTKVDVQWQDGKRENGLDSKSLLPIHTPSDHEFFPDQYVVEKASNEDDSSELKRVGIVRSVNAKERTVCVRWFKPVFSPVDTREFDCDEVVSAYELEEHPDYDYCYGDVVVRLSPLPISDDLAKLENSVEEPEKLAGSLKAQGDASRNDSDDETEQIGNDELCSNFTSLSWVGNITGLEDGDIEVTWADGMVSKVGPQAIYVVGREDGESFDGGSEVSDDAASWETVDEHEQDITDDLEKSADFRNPTTNTGEKGEGTTVPLEDVDPGRSGPLSVPLAALGFVTKLATGLFYRGRKQVGQSDSAQLDTNGAESPEIGTCERETASSKPDYEESDALGGLSAQHAQNIAEDSSLVPLTDAESKAGDDLETSATVELKASCSKDDTDDFKHFDIAENPLDHYFLGESGQNDGRKWAKKVSHEWSILEKNLPDAIYVRVFEDRMDLLRAVIVGASGTPYQDGLFFFDFHLPTDYPQVPPSAYYHSGGLRVNPNLYVNGKVCLSLLNTWTGKGNEVWDPSASSILQVLVSLQGLVLNSKPYFNEAGYEKQVGTMEGEKNSLPYNENTYLLNLKSMMYLLRKPPMHFEDLVKGHFRRRGQYILKACEAYMNGCFIGSLTKDADITAKSMEQSCSAGFKLMLAKVLPRLVSALSEVGVDCQQFKHLQGSS